jgi:hypothetical protein
MNDSESSQDGQVGVLVAVTDHACERFGQRAARRRGELQERTELAGRVAEAWAAGRTCTKPQGPTTPEPPRGSVYLRDVHERDLVFVCRHDRRAQELVLITLYETERLRPARVPRRFTDALKQRPVRH